MDLPLHGVSHHRTERPGAQAGTPDGQLPPRDERAEGVAGLIRTTPVQGLMAVAERLLEENAGDKPGLLAVHLALANRYRDAKWNVLEQEQLLGAFRHAQDIDSPKVKEVFALPIATRLMQLYWNQPSEASHWAGEALVLVMDLYGRNSREGTFAVLNYGAASVRSGEQVRGERLLNEAIDLAKRYLSSDECRQVRRAAERLLGRSGESVA